MRFRTLVLLGLVGAFVVGSAVAQAGNCTQIDNSTRPDCPSAIAFFRRFQSALKKNDRREVASLMAYPLLASLNHKRVRIGNQLQLLAHFDDVFDSSVRCEILHATDKDVWGNYQGFTVGDGAVWFDGVIPPGEHPDTKAPDYWTKYPFKVITVNNDSYYPCTTS